MRADRITNSFGKQLHLISIPMNKLNLQVWNDIRVTTQVSVNFPFKYALNRKENHAWTYLSIQLFPPAHFHVLNKKYGSYLYDTLYNSWFWLGTPNIRCRPWQRISEQSWRYHADSTRTIVYIVIVFYSLWR